MSARRAGRAFGGSVDDVCHGLSLSEIQLRYSGKHGGQNSPEFGMTARAELDAQRRTSACSTSGEPCACISSTSSPVNDARRGEQSDAVADDVAGAVNEARVLRQARCQHAPQSASVSGCRPRPDTRTTMPTPPRPGGVAMATMVSGPVISSRGKAAPTRCPSAN